MFIENLKSLMAERGLNNNSLSIQSGIPYTTIDGFFKRGYENIKLSTLRQLATFFEVDLDFLVYGEGSKEQQLTNVEKSFLSAYNNLNELGKSKARDYINDLNENEKYILKQNTKG